MLCLIITFNKTYNSTVSLSINNDAATASEKYYFALGIYYILL